MHRLPQLHDGFKALWLSALLVAAPALPAGAQDTEEILAQPPLFSCSTDPDDDRGFLWLSGTETDAGAHGDLHFVWLADHDGHLLLRYPTGKSTTASFGFAHSDGPEGYLVTIHFADAGRDYVLYSLSTAPDPTDPSDMGGGDAGLSVSQGGRLLEQVSCTERPYMFIDYMREAMSCDDTTPEGAAACANNPPQRKSRLDTARIGLPR